MSSFFSLRGVLRFVGAHFRITYPSAPFHFGVGLASVERRLLDILPFIPFPTLHLSRFLVTRVTSESIRAFGRVTTLGMLLRHFRIHRTLVRPFLLRVS